ncbi:uracil-xanthine permease family protein [Azospirillum halopraeferens]|uniref:uracil-xanthine permease family protein n=1 Tax=Azospirillum halopraeferens TaxID=34010 RepID=UPI000416214B|nr:solute carrier family 23 protein [Azospirillum halopraeferens]
MSERPPHLLYALDERPPARAVAVLSVQHLVLALMFMVYPVIVATELGLSREATMGMVTTATLIVGLGTMLQATRFGSGFLAVIIPNPIVLPALIAAARTAGPGAAFGTLVVCGIAQMGLARLLPRLRSYFPPEVCGVAVMMLGVSLVSGGIGRFTGYDAAAGGADSAAVATGLATLGCIVVLTVWAKGPMRLYAVLIGCAAGYGTAAALGLVGPEVAQALAEAPAVAMPAPMFPELSFSLHILPPLFIATLITMMDSVGSIVSLDKMNTAHWARTDMRLLSRGLFADGATTTLAASVGTLGTGFSSANIGLAFASGVTARVVGLVTGALLVAAAFVPKLTTLLILMPRPVIGAVLVFTAACLITAGMELIMSRLLNERRMLVIGLSTILGLSVAALPGLYHGVPDWARPLVGSELTVAAAAALILNMVFRIGAVRRARVAFTPGHTPLGDLYEFMETQGGVWGARRDVVQRATLALIEAMETLSRDGLARGEVTVEAAFDELNLDLRLRYAGSPPALGAGAVDIRALLESEGDAGIDEAMRSVSGTLITRVADRVTASSRGDEAVLALHFDH